ncbi:GNAT family N-acetyltransferase [Actinoplanes sp. CA-030573]|uniref:GNAT family N-acetyltransferase n=1 Tax=Actinoplanes sp. CA-030573 TaxID=3239898 RepID=UPI003D8A5C9F
MNTDRLSLRPPGEADADAILRIHADPVACEHNPSDMITVRAEAVDRCRRWMAHWQRHGYGYYVLRRHGSEHVVGFCGVKLMRLHERPVLNLFYRLEPAAWGAGLASEAASAVVASVAGVGLPVIARVRPGNAASARVAVRAGLRRAEHLDTAGADGLDWIFADRPVAGPA